MDTVNNQETTGLPEKVIDKTLSDGIIFADHYINQQYLSNLDQKVLVPVNPAAQSAMFLSLFEIRKIIYDPEEGIKDKLVSVYSAIANFGSYAFILLLGGKKDVRFFVGTRDDQRPDIAGKLMSKSLHGNFPGIELIEQMPDEIDTIMNKAFPESYCRQNVVSVSIVPSERQNREEKYVQGIEKFIDTMAGEEYAALLLAKPLDKQELNIKKQSFEELATTLSKCESATYAYAESDSDSVAQGVSESFTESINRSVSHATSTNQNFSVGRNYSSSFGGGITIPFVGINRNHSTNWGRSTTKTTGTSESETDTSGSTEGKTTGSSDTKTKTTGKTNTITITAKNKSVENVLKKIDEELERIKMCESFGLWDGACYFVSDRQETALIAANTYKALVSGESTCVENSFINLWDSSLKHKEKTLGVMGYIRYGMHPVFSFPAQIDAISNSSVADDNFITPACLISGIELPIFLGLPQKSVNGVTSIPAAEFGRNVIKDQDEIGNRIIGLGSLFHMGNVIPEKRVNLTVNTLSSHCFITGTSGSGKSNTVYKILEELIHLQTSDGGYSKVKFLVIEPAKGEYKSAFGNLPNINIYTTNPKYYKMLQLNPFAFPDGIHVLEHLDRLIEIFSACWPLYAAMPAVLKDSFERAYQQVGWDLKYSKYLGKGSARFPTFEHVLTALPEVIEESEFSGENKGNYTGALVTRVKSLTKGIMGTVFCSQGCVPDSKLFDEDTIVDLSRVGSAETKSLLMGVLVLKLNEFRMANAVESDVPLQHITILEEAHNLLKRTSGGGGGDPESADVQGKSVEMITNSIAEMRTYGEGFLIIDQSPSAVADAAIINTNTKIVMRLASYDDCEVIGKSIGLEEPQIRQLSRLNRGVAAVAQSNWLEAVLVKIDKADKSYKVKSIPVNEDHKVKKMLGELIAEFLAQYEDEDFETTWLYSIVNKARIGNQEKDKYKTIIQEFSELELDEQLDAFDECIIKLLDCEGMLHAIVPGIANRLIEYETLSKRTLNKSLAWGNRIKRVLENYAEIDDSLIDDLAKRIFYYIFNNPYSKRYKMASYIVIKQWYMDS